MHLMDLAAEVKRGVEDVGMVGYRFNTIGVSDGISMGTDGMSFSLQSREIIADSIETVMSAQWYDANISLPGENERATAALLLLFDGANVMAGYSNCIASDPAWKP